jgi:hypothetical protein
VPILRPAVLAAAALLLVAGCTGGGDPAADGDPTPSSSEAAGEVDPILRGLDVCALLPPALAERASGVPVEPSSRRLTSLPGYAGVVDECRFGVSFGSSAVTLAVGLAPATGADLRRVGGRPRAGVGGPARTRVTPTDESVTFLRGATLVELRSPVSADAPSRLARLVEVARVLAPDVPADPPESDEQTTGRCQDLSTDRVDGVLGSPAGLSRSLSYADGSAVCSWATGITKARTVTVAMYTNRQAGPFLASQQDTGPSTPVRGVPGEAFTTPASAYVVADDGQAVAINGSFAGARNGRPLPVTPELTALMGDAASALG